MGYRLPLIISFTLLGLYVPKNVWAVTDADVVETTIELSVCGDGKIEGKEDCEGSNLHGHSCTSLAFASGTLTCDQACEFDTTNCIDPTPTPTSTPSPTPTATPSPTPAASSTTATTTPSPTSASIPSPTPESITAPFPLSLVSTVLQPFPDRLRLFGIDNSGIIKKEYIFTAVKSWVETWKQELIRELAQEGNQLNPEADPKACDIDDDQSCDLRDLSILLYYFE